MSHSDATPVRPDAPDADDLNRPDSPAAWFVRLLKGVAVGVGAILPGLSGGVLAVIFKIYDPMIKFLARPFHRFWDNVRYFIPVGIGGVIGVVLFSILVSAAFGKYEPLFVTLFIGFVVGTFPSLWRQAGQQGRTTKHLIILAVAAVAIFALMLLGGQMDLDVTPNLPVWIASGLIVGLGAIVPGMSPSNFLIYFGLYNKMTDGIKDGDFGVIIPLFIGVVLSVLLFAKAANWAFQHHYAGMYHFILGLVVGSSLAIFPTVVFVPEDMAKTELSLPIFLLACLVMLAIGTVASWAFSKVEDRYSGEREALEATR